MVRKKKNRGTKKFPPPRLLYYIRAPCGGFFGREAQRTTTGEGIGTQVEHQLSALQLL